jgi:hypothetical protein
MVAKPGEEVVFAVVYIALITKEKIIDLLTSHFRIIII